MLQIKRKVQLLGVVLLCMVLLLSGCVNDVSGPSDGTAHLSLSLDVGKATRGLSDGEKTVNDITVLVFDGSNNLIGSKYSTFTKAPYTMDVITRTGTNCTVCAVANTGSSTFFSDVSTLDQFNSKTTKIISPSDLNNATSVTMFGKKTGVAISQNTTLTDFSLARLCSKLNLVITPASGVTITGYRLCHVPENSYIYDGNSSSNPSNTYPDFDDVTDLNSTDPVKGTYYMYENLAGKKSESTTEELRTSTNAPTNATYLLVSSKTNSWHSTCRIYLGGTNSKDYTNYNIPRNYNYTYNIAINTAGQGDARVTYTCDLATSAVSNCYLVSPGSSISIPVSRVNDFWGGDGYNSDYMIGKDDHWQADILWQDYSGLVTLEKSTGVGPDATICIHAPLNAPFGNALLGNALIGIRKTSGKGKGLNLWSWHIWVTGYDPNSSYALFNQKKWMKYNLGATDDTGANSYGLYYQWGRKDPFQDDGTGINSDGSGYGDNLASSVQNPAQFYVAGTPPYDWYTDFSTLQNDDLWGGSKTIYDPCPDGWKVPTKGDWNSVFIDGSFSLPPAGYLDCSSKAFHSGFPYYWDATTTADGQAYLFPSYPDLKKERAGGVPIRCVQDN